MADDKRIINTLLDGLEAFYLDIVLLKAMLKTYRNMFPEIGDWEDDFRLLKDAKRQDVKKQFSPLREAVYREGELERALQQFLADTPPKGSVH